MNQFNSTNHSTKLKTGTALCGILPSGLVAINQDECLSEWLATVQPQDLGWRQQPRSEVLWPMVFGRSGLEITMLPQKAVTLHIVCYSVLWKCARSRRFLIASNLFSATEIAVTARSLVRFLKETEGKKILPLWKAQCFGQLFMLAGILC